MPVKLHFTESDILRQNFKVRFKGYDPTQVNSFLDLVMVDYKTLKQAIQDLQRENNYLQSRMGPLKRIINQLRINQRKAEADKEFAYNSEQQHEKKLKGTIGSLMQEISYLRKEIKGLHKDVYNAQNRRFPKHMKKQARKLLKQQQKYEEKPWENPNNTLQILQKLHNIEKKVY